LKNFMIGLLSLFLVVPASAGTMSEDYNVCKTEVVDHCGNCRVEVKKIKGKTIDMKVYIPDYGKVVLTCFRNDYHIVSRKDKHVGSFFGNLLAEKE